MEAMKPSSHTEPRRFRWPTSEANGMVSNMLSWRKGMLAVFKQLADTYQNQGEQAFLDAVKAIPGTRPEVFAARIVADLQREGDTPTVIQGIRNRLNAAAAKAAK